MIFFRANLKNFRASPPEPANGMEKYRTFALSKGTMEFGRRAPRICFQAWQNLLPAQSVKKEVANGDKERTITININQLKKLTNYGNESESSREATEV